MQEQIILVCSIFAILFGLYNVYKVLSVEVNASGKSGDDIEMQARDGNQSNEAIEAQMMEIAKLIQDGASTFLREEYTYTFLFIVIFGVIIFFTAEQEPMKPYTTIPFLLGALTSILSGYIGMQIAVRANVRTAK